MTKEGAKTQSDEIRMAKIKASVDWWARFDTWVRSRGYQTLPEALRAAVNECTARTDPSQA